MVKWIDFSHKLGKQNRQRPVVTNRPYKKTPLTTKVHDISNDNIIVVEQ